jgi:hypothetical protein
MPEYRAYLIKDRHVAAAPTMIEADADDDAIEQAKQPVDGHDVELWHGARFVIGLRSNTSRPPQLAASFRSCDGFSPEQEVARCHRTYGLCRQN